MKKILFALFILVGVVSVTFADTEIQRPTSDYQITGTPGYAPGSPANYHSHLSEIVRDDSGYAYYNGTPGALLFGFTAFSVPANATNISLTIHFTATIQTAGVSTMGVAVTVSNTAYPISASLINPTTSFVEYAYQLTTNPDTGSAWTVAEINGGGTKPLQAFGVYSTDCSPIVACSWCYAEVSYDVPTATPTFTPSYTTTPTFTPTFTPTPTITSTATTGGTPTITPTTIPSVQIRKKSFNKLFWWGW